MFNAFKYTKQLEEAGFTRDQAEIQLQVISEIVEGDLATKQDLSTSVERLEHEMQKLEYRLVIKLSGAVGAIVTLAIGVTAALTKSLS